jgi:DNA-binding GntR family transcriptional regulator
MSSKSTPPRNLSRVVFAAVRAEVLSGRLAPGERLSPRALATQHDLDDMRDLYRLRALIESTAFGDAIAHGDLEYETRVIASHHRLERTPAVSGDGSGAITDDWSAAHEQFHYELLSAATSPRLLELARRLRDTSELYRRWSGAFTGGLPPRDVAAEHHALMKAVLDRDVEGGVALITDHINLTATLLEAAAADDQADEDPPRVAVVRL